MIKLRRLFLLVFILDLAAFLFISSLPIHNSALYNSFASEDRSITSQAFIPMWLSIFPHNLLIATIEFIPIIGIFFFATSIYSTALVVAVEGVHDHTSGLVIAISLMMLPHFWLELPAYSVALSSGIYLLYYLIKGYPLKSYIKILYMYIFVVIELAIAGLIETSEIVLLKTKNPYSSFYMWIPGVFLIAFLIYLYRHFDKDEYKSKHKELIDDIFNNS